MRRFVTLLLPFIPLVGMIGMIGTFVVGIHTYDKMAKPTLHFQINPYIRHINAIKELVEKKHLYAEAFFQWELFLETRERERRKIENGENSATLFLAQAFAQENQQEYAMCIFEYLVEDSRITSNHGVYAQWLLKWGNIERALEMMQTVHQTDTNFKVADYLLYTKILDRAGRRKDALQLAREGLEKQKLYAADVDYMFLKTYFTKLKGSSAHMTTL